jgi:hypothetical protein
VQTTTVFACGPFVGRFAQRPHGYRRMAQGGAMLSSLGLLGASVVTANPGLLFLSVSFALLFSIWEDRAVQWGVAQYPTATPRNQGLHERFVVCAVACVAGRRGGTR